MIFPESNQADNRKIKHLHVHASFFLLLLAEVEDQQMRQVDLLYLNALANSHFIQNVTQMLCVTKAFIGTSRKTSSFNVSCPRTATTC